MICIKDVIANIKAGDRVIITALGTEACADAVIRAGGYPVFCDVTADGRDADIAHLRELAAQGAAGFISTCEGAGTQYANACGIPTGLCEQGEFSRPAYRSKVCRFAAPAPDQYPYYMLVLANAERICRGKDF